MIPPFDSHINHPFVDFRAKLPRDLARATTSGKGPMGALSLQVQGGAPRVVSYLTGRYGAESSLFVHTDALDGYAAHISMGAAMCLVRYAKLCGFAYCDQARARENSMAFYLGVERHGDTRVTFSFRAANRPETIVLADLTLPIDVS